MYVQCIPPQTGLPPAQRGTRSEGHFACRRRRFRRFVMVHGPILDPCSTHLGLILDPYWALLGSLGALLWALLWAPAARASDELEMCVFPRKMLGAPFVPQPNGPPSYHTSTPQARAVWGICGACPFLPRGARGAKVFCSPQAPISAICNGS